MPPNARAMRFAGKQEKQTANRRSRIAVLNEPIAAGRQRELLARPDSKGVLGTLNVFVCPPLRSLFRNVRPSTRLLS